MNVKDRISVKTGSYKWLWTHKISMGYKGWFRLSPISGVGSLWSFISHWNFQGSKVKVQMLTEKWGDQGHPKCPTSNGHTNSDFEHNISYTWNTFLYLTPPLPLSLSLSPPIFNITYLACLIIVISCTSGVINVKKRRWRISGREKEEWARGGCLSIWCTFHSTEEKEEGELVTKLYISSLCFDF